MTYEEFKMAVFQQIERRLSPGTSVQLQKIRKNNGLELDGLTISNAHSNISPTIFLNYYYEKQNHFPDLDAVCRDILLTYEHNKSTESIDADFFTNYRLAKERLAYRVINYEKNKELLQTVPYVRYLDLAVVFYCLLKISEKGSATILIHTNHLHLWHINTTELYEQTCQMTPQLLPYDFRNMTAVLSEIFEARDTPTFHAEQSAESFCPMYVLTNSHKLYGAGCILYPRLLETISEKLGSDLFILPSSIHETIILPADSRRQSEELADMVTEINQTELAPDEILSNNVYYYSKSGQTLSIC